MHDLLDLDVDVNAFLPPDTMSAGFDNIADVQTFSPTLMEGYLRAASQDLDARGRRSQRQPDRSHLQGAAHAVADAARRRHAVGHARRHLASMHTFPADGDYTFRIMLHGTPTGQLFGSVASRNEQIEVSINGERVALLDIDYKMSETDKNGLNLHDAARSTSRPARSASPRRSSRSSTASSTTWSRRSTTRWPTPSTATTPASRSLPHVRDFSITGPYKVTGVSDTPSRRKVFICRPTSPADEIPCARADPLERWRARPTAGRPTNEDVESLMEFYGDGAQGRTTSRPASRRRCRRCWRARSSCSASRARRRRRAAGQTYRISDLDLASRLSFFIWDTVPGRRAA